MKSAFAIILLSISYTLTSQTFQKEVLFDNSTGYGAKPGDFDRDGDLDILAFYTEINPSGNTVIVTNILENTHEGFEPLDVGLPSFGGDGEAIVASINWVDYNSDGYLDIFMTLTRSQSPIVTRLYLNNKDKTFSQTSLTITDIIPNTLIDPSFGDYDNDGDLDLLYYGMASFSETALKIYENVNDQNEFLDVNLDFGNSEIKSQNPWADFNNDGFLDFMAIEPISTGERKLVIFKNNGDKTFSKMIFNDLDGLNLDHLNNTGDMAWGDYNGDGFLDILLAGQFGSSTGDGTTALYENNGDESFTDLQLVSIHDVNSDVSIEWGDFNQDGLLDVLHTGASAQDGVIGQTRVFTNVQGNFTEAPVSNFLKNRQNGLSIAADLNNDNRLDILVMGEVSFTNAQVSFYYNTTPQPNIPPSPPTILEASFDDEFITFSWNTGNDDHTPIQSLSYNLYVIQDNDTIVNANSLDNGTRMISKPGNAQLNTSFKLRNRGNAIYRWGVQSIDNSYVGSEFSAQSTIEIDQVVVGIEDNLMSGLKSYPNPFHNQFTISTEKIGQADEIFITDIYGKRILSLSNVSFPFTIENFDFPSGVYTVHMISGNNKDFLKIIKK